MKTMRKLTAMLLVLCLALSTALPTFAAGSGTSGAIFGFSQEEEGKSEARTDAAADGKKQSAGKNTAASDAEKNGAGEQTEAEQGKDTDPAAEDLQKAEDAQEKGKAASDAESAETADEKKTDAAESQAAEDAARTTEDDGRIDAAEENEDTAAFFNLRDSASRELSYEGSDYTVTVFAGADAGLPEDASLKVREIRQDTAAEEYETYRTQAEETARENGAELDTEQAARFFDITIETKAGGLLGLFGMKDEVEPQAPVSVKIACRNTEKLKENVSVKAVHLPENAENTMVSAVVNPVETTGEDAVREQAAQAEAASGAQTVDEVGFVADSFSVYGIVYTVDFWNGEYSFSIAGESAVLLSDVLKNIGITDINVSEIETVTFSDEELVKVTKKDGDWMLTSLKAFDTEETLTLVQKNGKVTEILVTDAPAGYTLDSYIDPRVPGTVSVPQTILSPGQEELDRLANNGYKAGESNDFSADSTSKDAIWKKAVYKSDGSVDISFEYFQKRYGSNLDFIFVLDESLTMDDYETLTVNGTQYKERRGIWSRLVAMKASKGLFAGNDRSLDSNGSLGYHGEKNGYQNRVAFILHRDKVISSDFLNSYTKVKSWMLDHPDDYTGTYHSRAVKAAIAKSQESIDQGRTPVVIYMSDFGGYATYGTNDHHLHQADTDVLNQKAEVYTVLVYPESKTYSQGRMANVAYNAAHRKTMGNDPGGLMAIFQDIISDAISTIPSTTKIEDQLSSSMKANMVSGSQNLNAGGSNAGSASYSGGTVNWTLSGKLENGKLYSRTINIPLDQNQVYSGSMPTNGDCTLKDGNKELNKITAGNAPILKKDVSMTLGMKTEAGEETDTVLSNVRYILTKDGTEVWSGTTDSSGTLTIPYTTVPFEAGSEYILTQDKSTTPDTVVIPDSCTWKLTVGDDYVIRSSRVGADLDMTVKSGAFRIWNTQYVYHPEPLKAIVVQKIWDGSVPDSQKQDVPFAVYGIKDGQKTKLNAYSEDDRGSAKVTTLTSSDNYTEGTPQINGWARKVYVDVYDSYEIAEGDGVVVKDASDGVGAPGRWEDVKSGEVNFSEVKEAAKTEIDTSVYQNGDYHYYLRISNNEYPRWDYKDVKYIDFGFEYTDTLDNNKRKLAEFSVSLQNSITVHNADYLEKGHNSIEINRFYLGNNFTNRVLTYITLLNSKKEVVVKKNSRGNTANYGFYQKNQSYKDGQYVEKEGGFHYYEYNGYAADGSDNLPTLTVQEIEEDEPEMTEVTIPGYTLTNTFTSYKKLTINSNWNDDSTDSSSTNSITKVKYTVLANGQEIETPEVNKGDSLSVYVPDNASYTVKQDYYRVDGLEKTVFADDSGSFSAYTTEASNDSGTFDDAKTVTFTNTRKNLNVTVRTEWDPMPESDDPVLNTEIAYDLIYKNYKDGSQAESKVSGTNSKSNAWMNSDHGKLPAYSVDGTETECAVTTEGLEETLSDYIITQERQEDLENGKLTFVIRNTIRMGTILINKEWKESKWEEEELPLPESIDVTVTGGGRSETVKLSHANGWYAELELPVKQTYTITEAVPERYNVSYQTVQYTADGETTADTGDAAQVALTVNDAEVDITNQYDPNTLTVTKQVTGPMGDRTQSFTFTVKGLTAGEEVAWMKQEKTESGDTADGAYQDLAAGASGSETADEKGEITFTLKDDQKIELNVPQDKELTLTEQETTGCVTKMDGQNGSAKTIESLEDDDVTVNVVNDFPQVADTGLDPTSLGYLALLLAGVLVATGVIVVRARRRQA